MIKFLDIITKYSGLNLFVFKAKNKEGWSYPVKILFRSLIFSILMFLLLVLYDFNRWILLGSEIGDIADSVVQYGFRMFIMFYTLSPFLYVFNYKQESKFETSKKIFTAVFGLCTASLGYYMVTL